MSTRARESRPNLARNEAAAAFSSAETSLLPFLHIEDADAAAEAVEGALVVCVRVADAKYRRRVFLTAKAAEAAVRRARGRGQTATLLLAELRPTYVVGGEL